MKTLKEKERQEENQKIFDKLSIITTRFFDDLYKGNLDEEKIKIFIYIRDETVKQMGEWWVHKVLYDCQHLFGG